MKIRFLSFIIVLFIGCTNDVENSITLPEKSSQSNLNSYFTLPKGFVIEKVINEDFDNNSINDHIYLAFSEELSELREFWVDDKGKLFLMLENLPSQNFHLFVDIDNDKHKEVILIRGYEDGSDAQIAKINFEKRTLDTLFYFNPLVLKNGNYYWGYAWDIEHLLVNQEQQILSSYTHIDREDDFKMVKSQKKMPILIFSPNRHFKPFIQKPIQDAEYHSLEEIIEFSFSDNSQ